jgi:outer membrane protein assembly factor BamB
VVGVLATVLTAALAPGAATPATPAAAAEPVTWVVPRPPFAGPAGAPPAGGRARLELVSSRSVDPALSPPLPGPPSWAPRRFRGSELVLAVRQTGAVLLAYGDPAGLARYLVATTPTGKTRYALDVSALGRGGSWPLELRWAHERAGVLYLANAHRTYASTTGNRNGYLTALDLRARRLLWQSASLVANANTFAVVQGVIVTGYGFTQERDYLYALDRRSGRAIDRLPVPTAPETIAASGTTLSVRTYDHRLVVRLRLP